MKIMICGSMSFAKDMLEMQRKLRDMGHKVSVPCDTEEHIKGATDIDNFEGNRKHCIEKNVMKRCFDQIAESDGILILNYPKNGIEGYVGTSSLMEAGLAHYLGKKIFLLHPIPKPEEARWAHELMVFQPHIVDGDLKKIR